MHLCEVHSSSLRPVPDSEPAGFRMLPAVAIVFGWSDLRYVHPFRARVFVYAVLVFFSLHAITLKHGLPYMLQLSLSPLRGMANK